MEFKNLGLAEPIVRAVAREGYTLPTPIQIKAIPHVLAGRDLLGCAQTGTGKTAAFALPILHRLSQTSTRPARRTSTGAANGSGRGHARPPRALVLAPTRELASQIGESFRVYGRGLHLKHATVFGGVNQNPQVRALKAGIDILVATPGRLMDLMNQGHIDLRGIEILVLDEADRMLDMGFLPDIRRIIARIPRQRQTLMFSATMPADIRALAASILHEPVSVQVDRESSAVTLIAQSVYHVPAKSKLALLRSVLRGEASGRTLVFTRTKHGADRIVKDLTRAGIRAAAIHGNKNQNARTRALDSFKSESPPVLVATDIASRGIDVDEIQHVINFDVPNVAETYVHRIGRTARAGASGAAVSFCGPDERESLRAIERLIGRRIAGRTDLPEFASEAAPAEAAARRPASAAAARRPERGGGAGGFGAGGSGAGGSGAGGSGAGGRVSESRRAQREGAGRKSKRRSTPRSSSSPHTAPKRRSRDTGTFGAASGSDGTGRRARRNGRPGGQPRRRSGGGRSR